MFINSDETNMMMVLGLGVIDWDLKDHPNLIINLQPCKYSISNILTSSVYSLTQTPLMEIGLVGSRLGKKNKSYINHTQRSGSIINGFLRTVAKHASGITRHMRYHRVLKKWLNKWFEALESMGKRLSRWPAFSGLF